MNETVDAIYCLIHHYGGKMMVSMSIPSNRDFVITDTYTNDNRREFYIENNSDSLWKQEKDLKILMTTRTIQVINAMIAPNGRISIKIF